MVDSHQRQSTLSVSVDDLSAWHDEVRSIEGKIRELEARRELLRARINMTQMLFTLLDDTAPSKPPSIPPKAPQFRKYSQPTFVNAVRHTVVTSRDGWLAPKQVREVIENGPLGEKIKESDKGYHHAISRLSQRGEIIRRDGWLVDPSRYRLFAAAMNAGEIKPQPRSARNPDSRTGSAMGDEMLEFVELMGRQSPQSLLNWVSKDPRFSVTVNKNASAAYNVMARLHKRGIFVKVDGHYDVAREWVNNNKLPSSDISKEGNLI
jgi:hypothetical protein